MLGPVIGGLLTEYLSWPWIFWINLPVGLLALALVRSALRTLPLPHTSAPPRIDLPGALLLLGGLTALLIPITRIGQGAPWHAAGNLLGWALAAALLALFVRQERCHPDPIVPMALFANRAVLGCCALLFVCFFNFIAMSVLVPLRLQLVAGLSAADAALRLLPLTLAIPAAAFASGRWLYRTGRVLPAQRLGVALVPAALLALGFGDPTGKLASLALVALGIGMGLQLPTTLITVQQSVPRAQIGTVTALTAFFRLLGGAVGIAVLSSVLLLLLREHLPAGANAPGLDGFAQLFEMSRAGHSAAGAGDAAFRQVSWLAAAGSLASLWFVSWLPDLRLHDTAVASTRTGIDS